MNRVGGKTAQTTEWFRSNGQHQLQHSDNAIELCTTLRTRQRISFTRDVFSKENDLLESIFERDPVLIVMSRSISNLYGARIASYLRRNCNEPRHRILTLNCSEQNKTMDTVLDICREACDLCLGRRAKIVAIGGGVCCDLCGFAAAIYRRGISHIKIPTTLLGLVDAGVATKNGVNLDGRKNAIGTFYVPEHSIIDPEFLNTLPERHFRSGLSEICKIAIVFHPSLFATLWKHMDSLRGSGTRLIHSAKEFVYETAQSHARLLSEDLYETATYQRILDFGHTFSPFIERTTHYQVTHGEAVAVDMALSTIISHQIGRISGCESDRILDLLAALRLFPTELTLDAGDLWRSLADIEAHRNGSLNMPLPTGVGTHFFLKSKEGLELGSVQAALNEWQRRLCVASA